jgi:tRNA pseudouridine38-40 synthase
MAKGGCPKDDHEPSAFSLQPSALTTIKIILAYDGTGFVGWQRQAAGTSIQGLVEDALRPLAGQDVAVAGAGRTDAGVHALGQAASLTLDRSIEPATIVRALNARLPPEVRILSAQEVPASFHARFSARGKSYRYRIWNAHVEHPFERRYAWHVTERLDVDAMAAAAALLEGEHDFAAFQAAGSDATSTVRTIAHCALRLADQPLSACIQSAVPGSRSAMIEFDLAGTGFLRHMVRAVVGSLVEVGRGRRAPAWLGELVRGGRRADAGPTVPAHGLFLVAVDYDADDLLAAEP